MARTLIEIRKEMDNKQATMPGLALLNSPSQSSIASLWKNLTSYAIFVMENFWDLFRADLETYVDTIPVGTNGWVQREVFKFQYDALNPQIVQLIDFVPSYPNIDTTLQIITRCSSVTKPNKTVDVKVAKSEPPVALLPVELSSLKGYIGDIGFAGVYYNIISLPADQLFFEADIFYNGQYSGTIQNDVLDAINNVYLANLPFDGILKVSAIEDAIQNVTGVTDIVIKNMTIRADGLPFGTGINMVLNSTLLTRSSSTQAGYIIGETTVGQTLADKIKFYVG